MKQENPSLIYDDILAEAELHDVEHILCVATEESDFAEIHSICKKYSPKVSGSIGIHPLEPMQSFDNVIKSAQAHHIVAIGETGLDFYRETTEYPLRQQEKFVQHIELAKNLKKPLIIHTRAAAQETIRQLQQEQAGTIGGIMHSFTEDWEIARAALDLGFYISMSGIVTFKNAIQVQEVARKIPLDRLLIETDAPYLAPVPKRGKPNQPAYVKYTAAFVASLRNLEIEVLAEHTTQNYKTLFPTPV